MRSSSPHRARIGRASQRGNATQQSTSDKIDIGNLFLVLAEHICYLTNSTLATRFTTAIIAHSIGILSRA